MQLLTFESWHDFPTLNTAEVRKLSHKEFEVIHGPSNQEQYNYVGYKECSFEWNTNVITLQISRRDRKIWMAKLYLLHLCKQRREIYRYFPTQQTSKCRSSGSQVHWTSFLVPPPKPRADLVQMIPTILKQSVLRLIEHKSLLLQR